tara:strand:- start:1609 stop:2721 length:1113 start_codon:yes stop_codon:yes gene_type:complete
VDELLLILEENHSGRITDVFTLEELQLIKEHFNSSILFKENLKAVGNNIKLSTTQSVTTIQAADIVPNDLSAIDILSNSPNTNFEGAGVVIRGSSNQSTDAYIILDTSNRLQHRNPITGTYTDLGEVTGIPAGVSITGLTRGANDNLMIGIATNGTSGQSALYSINISTLTATFISGNDLTLPIALAEDGNGELVTIDIDNDTAYRINPITGFPTEIGPIGYDANFGQGLTYSPTEGKVYNTAYNSTVGDSVLYEMNLTTGELLAIGIIQPGLQQQFGWAGAYDPSLLAAADTSLEGFIYYPNPSKDFVVLEGTQPLQKIELFSILGEKIYAENFEARLKKLDVSFLAKGTYVLRVTSANQAGTYKLIKN